MRWITRKFETVGYPNAQSAVKILANLHYAPVPDFFFLWKSYYQKMNELTQHIDYKVPGLFRGNLYSDEHCLYIHRRQF